MLCKKIQFSPYTIGWPYPIGLDNLKVPAQDPALLLTWEANKLGLEGFRIYRVSVTPGFPNSTITIEYERADVVVEITPEMVEVGYR